LPTDPNAWTKALAGREPSLRALAERIREALADAPTLGPLLKVELALKREIERFSGALELGEGTLFTSEFSADAFGRAEAALLGALEQVAKQASSSPAERLLAAEATDALGFVQALRQRYDAILMN